ncbi:MAG: hypothetical protein ACFCVH_16150 [Alphaproteobacteria bacterium]
MIARFMLALALLAALAPAAAQDVRLPTRCECADCFAFMERRSRMATQLYTQGLQDMILLREGAPLVANGEGGFARDEAAVLQGQRAMVGGIRDAIGNGLRALNPLAPQCKIGLDSDPIWGSFIHVATDCTIPQRERLTIQLAVPCPEMYLAVLVHELSHVADCIALGTPRRPFTPEELMQSEIKAGQAEEDVLAVLRHQRLEECRRQSLPVTTPLHTDWNTALRFLNEARQYDREVNL